jgi:hypothetical protein
MMLDPAPLSTQPALASRHNGPFEVEILRGHFFRLDLFEVENGVGEKCVTGGSLQYGIESITLDTDHAHHLADQVRAAIDNAIAGSVMHRPSLCSTGH